MGYNYKEFKTVAVLASQLESGIALNVLGHLSQTMGANMPKEALGREFLTDKTGIRHRGISKYPVIVTRVKSSTVRRTIQEARANPNIILAEFPKEMLDTGHDDELSAAISNIEEEQIEYLGALLFGKSEEIDRITGHFMLWK